VRHLANHFLIGFVFPRMNTPLFRGLAITFTLLSALSMAAAEAPKKVLVVTVTAGFRHSSIPTSEKILEQLAKESGKFTVDFVRQPAGEPKAPSRLKAGADEAAQKKYAEDEKAYNAAGPAWTAKLAEALKPLSPANLKNYDAVMFVSTTGDLPLPDKQGFVDWIASGKGFMGIHAAADTFEQTGKFPGFAPYIAMLGGAFKTHGPQVTVECLNQDSKHAACAHLPAKWTVFDEIYQFKEFERSKVHGLLSLKELSLQGKEATPGDYPVAWTKMHGKGRVFYTSLGHREDIWDPTYEQGGRKNSAEIAKQYQQHVLNGILWTLGLAKGDATPQK
jgi:uncharacterized protein